MPISNNGPKKTTIIDTANISYVVAGNSSVSDIARPSSGEANEEIVAGAVISQIHWSTNGTINILRGSNTVLTLHGSGDWNMRHMGVGSLNESPEANLGIQIDSGTVMIELVKDRGDPYGSGYELILEEEEE